jgi:redox-sensitive bicupin YhaK (pirin superfamily)
VKETGIQPCSLEKTTYGDRESRKHGSMISVRRAEKRRHVRNGTQDTWLTFDPDNAADPFRHGFRTLEALNEEIPISEMSLHPHTGEDIEIVTYVREGALVHQDGARRLGRLRAGEFQRTSACRTIRHRVINGSLLNPAHVFQSCITPDGNEFEPGTEQKRFPVADRKGVLRLVASPDGRSGSLRIHQDVEMYSSILLVGHHLIHELSPGRAAWLHVVKGRVALQDHFLGTGDAAAVEDETAVSFTAQVPSEILLFNLA